MNRESDLEDPINNDDSTKIHPVVKQRDDTTDGIATNSSNDSSDAQSLDHEVSREAVSPPENLIESDNEVSRTICSNGSTSRAETGITLDNVTGEPDMNVHSDNIVFQVEQLQRRRLSMASSRTLVGKQPVAKVLPVDLLDESPEKKNLKTTWPLLLQNQL